MLLNCEFTCLQDCSSWIMLLLGFLLSVVWALFIYTLRPKLTIGCPKISEIDKKSIAVPVINERNCSEASKISIEIAVLKDAKTYSFVTDNNEFAFIPRNKNGNDNERIFKAYDVRDYLKAIDLDFVKVKELLSNNDSFLRVRVHATHSFSGLGKTFETKFKFKNGCFSPIEN